ncbi:hypothetical protein CBS101457_001498 [Exobasidium rhododendri]|nr:hypothetical protein CBS101457_001498 [Exobasidium rhododendri]
MHHDHPTQRPVPRSNIDMIGSPYHVVNIFKIPAVATQRDVRKAVGRRTYHMRRDPPVRFTVDVPRTNGRNIGKIIFAKADDAKAWIDKYGDRFSLDPVEVHGAQLSFTKSLERVDPFQLRAIQDVDSEEIDSDYDEEGDGLSHEKLLNLRRIECGGFDDNGSFCVGWHKEAKSRASAVSFDVDEARLRIRCEDIVIQASIYDIKWIYSDDKRERLYFEFRHPPMFLQDEKGSRSADSSAWLDSAPTNFSRQDEQYKRVSAFDRDHAHCVQYGTTYRVHLSRSTDLIPFIKSTKGRLILQAKVKEMPDGRGDVFDCSGVETMLEKLDFVVAFQAQALLGPQGLLPKDLINVRGEVVQLQAKLGAKKASSVLRNLKSDLCDRGPLARQEGRPHFTLKQVRERLVLASNIVVKKELYKKMEHRDQMMIHSVFITPSFGLRLEGPHPDEGNRILRQYPGQDENFIRVHLTEEDCSTFRVVHEYGSIDSEEMMHARFGVALRRGIMVGGRKYHYLAFSGSSLREHSCWFVRGFKFGGEKIKASTIRDNIGELTHLRNPARYAARMGQAFTATSNSVYVREEVVQTLPDIKSTDGKYEFSDGVGRMSQEVCDKINGVIFQDVSFTPTVPPSTFQIRMGGAKGMISLDTRLQGEQVLLRESMVKYKMKARDGLVPLEIAHFYTRPVPMFLNRQMISLLESLGVEAEAFMNLQRDALQALEEATLSPTAAIQLLHRSGVGRACNMEGIISMLHKNGINAVTQIPFLHDANISLVDFALRNMKYRARIRVPYCHTLVGVMDETNTLAEGQIVACINEPNHPIKYLKGRCLLGKSPMLAPGDLQYGYAVEPPRDHPLRAITNAVIFSQKGSRPLASMLSGGDLDGDLFNIIQHIDLMPEFTTDAADYAKNTMMELKRPCTVDDVIDFFLDYIKMDKLGLIATRHLELADRSKEGVLDPDCIKLAAMHSIAVDFPKSGLLPEIRAMPRAPRQKPDFRKPEYRNEDQSEDFHKKHPRSKDVYYPSVKALGQMFRGIDVYKQTSKWSKESSKVLQDWKEEIWMILSRTQPRSDGKGKTSKTWKAHLKEQRTFIEEYYSRLHVIAQEHSLESKSTNRLTEEEVFLGHTICRGPNGSRLSRFDATNRLQDDFQVIVQDFRKKVLFEKRFLRENDVMPLERRTIWQWLVIHVDKTITKHDLELVEIEQRGDSLECVVKQLYNAIERGLAWTKIALEVDDDDSKGRSAAWIIIPALLKANSCLDVLEDFLKRSGEARAEGDDGGDDGDDDDDNSSDQEKAGGNDDEQSSINGASSGATTPEVGSTGCPVAVEDSHAK